MKYLLLISLSVLFSLHLISFSNIFSESNYILPDQKLVQKWWQWHISIPNNEGQHPRVDYSTEKCNWGQDGGSIWFLPDGKEEESNLVPEIRTCFVPEGKSILVQILGSGCSTGERGIGTTEKDLRLCADWIYKENDEFTNKYDFNVTFDDVNMMNSYKFGSFGVIDYNALPSVEERSYKERFYVPECRTNLTYAFPSMYELNKNKLGPLIEDFTGEIGKYCDPDISGKFNATVSGTFFLSDPLKEGNHTLYIKTTVPPNNLDTAKTSERGTNYMYNLIVK